ncbi:MAG: class I SAM-dependent methyltransferase, partial [Arenimonas sp.]
IMNTPHSAILHMHIDTNPQSEQMGDESMLRTLAHQANAIWPQERPLFDRYALEGAVKILDLGCGSGEITRRLAQRYPQARLLGIDILEGPLAHARATNLDLGERVRFATGDAFALALPDAEFDLVVCRHLSQSVPGFPRVLAQIDRVLRPGGWLHLLSEDYAMLQLPQDVGAPDDFWQRTVLEFIAAQGCDGRIGRHTPPLVRALRYTDLRVDYAVVDTERVPRATFAGILRAWGDGFSAALAEASGQALEQVQARFAAMVAAVEDPDRYAVWHVPIISARKPGASA